MKRNFLVTTNLMSTWEFDEKNFLLGSWCEFPESNNFEKEQYKKKHNKEINTHLNKHHWENNDKLIEDYKYLKEAIEYLLKILSKNLSLVHNITESDEYWHPIIYTWLNQYVMTNFDRWETIRLFFDKNKDKEFYSNFILQDDLDFIPNDHVYFTQYTQNDYWNHLIFLRILNFLNISNLSLIEKKVEKKPLKLKNFLERKNLPVKTYLINFFDNIISRFAFKFNKIIFESFRFPKKDFLKICLKFKLIPALYNSIFNFKVKQNSFPENKKRIKLGNLLSNSGNKDKFTKFILDNLHKDIPKSYLENFNNIRKKILPLAKNKKTIFSMHSLTFNDNFKIYLAEAKKNGTNFFYVNHGGGLQRKMEPYYDFHEKVSEKHIILDERPEKNSLVRLGPTWPTINSKSEKTKEGKNCTIVFIEQPRYIVKLRTGYLFSHSINLFNEITDFVNSLKPEIKSHIKFRVKVNHGLDTERKFSELFGKKSIDKVNLKNTFQKSIFKSKLIIVTYAQTAFSEAMCSNVPTIMVIKNNHWILTDTSLYMFETLKKNKIAFNNFDDAKIHIDKYWDNLDLWWKSDNVQLARKKYLKSYFNVKPNWFKEWSDFINSQYKL